MLKKILWVLLIAFIVIQFIHPARNISKADQPNSIAKVHAIPTDVNNILDKACLDCHSNNTKYLWYFHIQPLDWWLTHHITEGKQHFNFDEFNNKSPRYRFNHLGEVIEQVKKNEMPISSYTWIHKDAILTEPEKNALINWAEGIRTEMKSQYPPDSLARKKQ